MHNVSTYELYLKNIDEKRKMVQICIKNIGQIL